MVLNTFLADHASVKHMAVMIVDDSEVTRALLVKVLANRGFTNILPVDSAEEALQNLEQFSPDIVIMDVMMPGMNGFDCCMAIRSMPEFKDLPVLIETSVTDLSLRIQAFESGATDFISSPILPDELLARVSVHLQNRKYIKDLSAFKARMTAEMNSAFQLQSSILPQQGDIDVLREQNGLVVESYFAPSSEIGGDFWGIKSVSPTQAAMWIADFSGHGVTAALNVFRLQAYLNENSPLAALPHDYMTYLNARLLQLLMKGHFATMFYGVVDAATSTLHYSCACTPNPILLRGSTGEVQWLNGAGNLLGVDNFSYEARQVPMEVGDTLILYSDALLETENESGDTISEDALLALVREHASSTPLELQDAIIARLMEHSKGVVADDLTVCVCKRVAKE